MDEYYVETKRMYNGFPTTTTCNYQEHIGKGPAAMLHMHEKIEILFCTEGGYNAILGGNEYTFMKGDLLIINSNEKHRTENLFDKSGLWVVQLDPDILYNPSLSIFETQYVIPFITQNGKHPRVVPSDVMRGGPLPELMRQVIREHTERAFGYELAIRGYLCQMFMWILRYWNNSGINLKQENIIGDKMMNALNQVFLYVNDHYDEDISVANIARMCNMSYSYFSRQFKHIMNLSFTDYLNFIRISKAESLLCQSDKNITEVAISVGYSDSAYFIQKFKQIKGISPNKYKKFYTLG